MSDLDRFDRLLLAAERSANVTAPSRAGWEHPSLVVGDEPRTPSPAQREPVITSTRPPRFVDYTGCPMCGHERLGVEYHGELMSGAKVHTLAAHSPSMARVQNGGKPRCLGAGLRMVFEGGTWKGAPS